MSAVAERVARGAAWLDEREPGWVERIDLDTLDMSDTCLCVLGQVFGEAALAADEFSGFSYGAEMLGDSAVAYGFDSEDYISLDAAWRALITEQQAAS